MREVALWIGALIIFFVFVVGLMQTLRGFFGKEGLQGIEKEYKDEQSKSD